MSDSLLKPGVIPSINYISDKLLKSGLGEEDLIVLIQRRTRGTKKDIRDTLVALRIIEGNIIEAEEKRRK